MGFAKVLTIILLLAPFTGCGGMTDDLFPSGSDKRPPAECGVAGPSVCQTAPDFTLYDVAGSSVTLSTVVTASGVQGTVLYFTMWCPVCDVHMSDLRSSVIPLYLGVRFFFVDYVSGSVADAASAAASNGYTGPGFTVLADTRQSVLNLYQGTMGTTVVIDRNGVIRMNEDYKDGQRLRNALAGLP
jgi:peroxiredoxin